MLITCVSGSPRKNQSSEKITDYAVEFFTKANWKTEKILLSAMDIPACIHCDYCGQTPPATRMRRPTG